VEAGWWDELIIGLVRGKRKQKEIQLYSDGVYPMHLQQTAALVTIRVAIVGELRAQSSPETSICVEEGRTRQQVFHSR
jgi:hypothetical protein